MGRIIDTVTKIADALISIMQALELGLGIAAANRSGSR